MPMISSVALDYPARFAGAPIEVKVTTQMFDIVAGSDRLLYKLVDGSEVIYSYTTEILSLNSTPHTHAIPQNYFQGFGIGQYTISVTSLRNGAEEQTVNTIYEVIDPPALYFVSIDPKRIALPISPPIDILASFYINGRNLNSVQGSFEIVGTPFTASINKTF